jgi:GcrA cell cycle regulator
MSWTDSRVDHLKSLWDEGSTASQIADAIGGVSRNAVIGKAHRLGLQPRLSPRHNLEEVSKRRTSPPRAKAAAPALPDAAASPPRVTKPAKVERDAAPAATASQKWPIPPAKPPAPPRRSVPAKPSAEIRGKTGLLDLTDKICKWPIGHPGEADFHFCGDAVNSRFPYCPSHCAVAYQVAKPRRDFGRSSSSFGGAWKR